MPHFIGEMRYSMRLYYLILSLQPVDRAGQIQTFDFTNLQDPFYIETLSFSSSLIHRNNTQGRLRPGHEKRLRLLTAHPIS
jgi:hypothetical protein